jgi:phosphoglycolate phosphatase
MKPYALVIFDWDGTLMDSEGRIVACIQAAQEKAGVHPQGREQIRRIIGLSLRTAIDTLHPDLPSSVCDVIEAEYRVQFLEKNTTESEPFEGVKALLDYLHQKGIQMAVATGKSRKGLDRVLSPEVTGFGEYFVITRSGEETASKPDPLMLTEILQQTQVALADALMIGDSTFDMEMAQRKGMDALAVTYGVHAQSELEAFNPVGVCQDAHQVLAWLKACYAQA